MAVLRKIEILRWLLRICVGGLIVAVPMAAAYAGVPVTTVADDGQKKDIQLYSGYHALVFGCADYSAGWPKLKNQASDAKAVATMFKNMGWTVDFIENPDGRTIRRELQKLVFNQGKDQTLGILIWFSGHGYTLQEADGTRLGYLVPVDATDPGIDPIGFTETAFSMRAIETVARQILAKHVLMIFDAPLSGDIFAMALPQPLDRLKESVSAPVRQFIIRNTPQTATSQTSTLKNIFIQSIQEGFADLNKDAYVTGEELGRYLSQKLAATDAARKGFFGRIDNPKLNKGNFVFTLPTAGSKKATTKPDNQGRPSPEKGKKTIVNSLGMTFQYLPPGKFQMGSPPNEPGRDKDETRHPVTLTRGFYMQTTEVTQKQWQTIMGTNPSTFGQCGEDCPVESVNWEEVQVYIQRLNQRDGHGRYRLPTEAEWEYACRAGTDTATYAGEMKILGERNAPSLSPIAWYGGNSCVDYPEGRDCSRWRQKQMECAVCGPHETGLKAPNAWGLYDMLGNVYEWCQDYFAEYPKTAVTDPGGPVRGTRRIVRGGAWDYHARSCRSANRNHFFPKARNFYVGFRLVMEPVK